MKLPAQFPSLFVEARNVGCFHCGARNEVPANAISLHCTACNKSIDIGSYEVESNQSRPLRTHGEVTIGPRGKYHGEKLIAGRLIVTGVLDTPFECEELIIGRVAYLSDTGKAERIYVLPGARGRCAKPLITDAAEIAGQFDLPLLAVHRHLKIVRGGVLACELFAVALDVEKGGCFEGMLHLGPIPENVLDLMPGSQSLTALPSAQAA